MLYTGLPVAAELGAMVLLAITLGMAAQVLLASCLSSYTQLRSDLRPPQATADGGINQDLQSCFSFLPLDPDVLDLVKQLGRRQPGNSLRRTKPFQGALSRQSELAPSGARCRFAFRPAHATSMRARNDTLAPRCRHSRY